MPETGHGLEKGDAPGVGRGVLLGHLLILAWKSLVVLFLRRGDDQCRADQEQ